MEQAFFLLFAIVAVVSAGWVVIAKNPIHSAVALMACFVQIAAIYVLLRSPFLAVVQVFVYVGAIMVLFVFVFMMLEIRQATLERFLPDRGWLSTLIPLLLGFILLGAIFSSPLISNMTPPVEPPSGSVRELGILMFTQYLLPFEVVSIVLLVALVGAIYLARKDDI
ncbi:MAG: NADH-quinone oxidoreductase subunit J [Oceanicoccus sp.]|uniref:NADH-quinone oxidoreductase subunit J family protein n=1 Tax=Oceanicoccus sp. TaxID=2691044 RepID=UPI00262B0553|nr:NADH-quinone oxidoreductase subunit J [Oceanicoccus sp.]MCP3907776.1 NADH-quinone oxidoreductase subunit J [Oceanicoccus sp.]